jgi:hypothetical protein
MISTKKTILILLIPYDKNIEQITNIFTTVTKNNSYKKLGVYNNSKQ